MGITIENWLSDAIGKIEGYYGQVRGAPNPPHMPPNEPVQPPSVEQPLPSPVHDPHPVHVHVPTRHYDFPLPYTLPGYEVGFAVQEITNAGLWGKLPSPFQQRIVDSMNHFEPLQIRQQDIDGLDDASWTTIASKLGLKWHNL